MFLDNPNLNKIEEGIFVYKNFSSKEEIEKINRIMSTYDKREFEFEQHGLDWYRDKTGPAIPQLIPVWNRISELIAPEYVIHPSMSLNVMLPGDEMFVHADSPGEGMEEDLTVHDRWSTCCVLSYGIVLYFGEFTGGEVFYPGLGIEYAVMPGDLIIHGAHVDHRHGVKEVKSGFRYAFSNFCLKREKNPGSFHNYGTEECLEMQKRPAEWIEPLYINPVFDENGKNKLTNP